jgi:hypothetical protein
MAELISIFFVSIISGNLKLKWIICNLRICVNSNASELNINFRIIDD